MRRFAILLSSLAGISLASAAPYAYVDWTSVGANTAMGTIAASGGAITVTLTGPFTSIYNDYPSYTPTSTYSGGVVGNTPDHNELVRIDGTGAFSLAFSRPVTNLAMDFWSVGNPGNAVTYTFDHAPTFQAGGGSVEYGGEAITVTGNAVTGREGNGVVTFGDTLTTLNWTIDNPEGFHGFTLGAPQVQATPEPVTLGLVAAGLGVATRRRKRSADPAGA